MSPFDDLRDALRTVVAIPVTPFGPDGEVDEATYVSLLGRLTDGGVTALTPNGNTGEYYALSPDERRRVVELTMRQAPGRTVIAGVGLDLATAIDDARFAREHGATAVMVHQPVHPFRSRAGWIEYHRAIAAAVPELGVIPYLKDPKIDAGTLGRLIEQCPNLVGVKYAIADPMRAARTLAELADAPVTWVCGVAEAWAPFFAVAGITCFTSGLVTISPAKSLRMLKALQAGDRDAAMDEWHSVRAFEELRAKDESEDNVSTVKEALHQLGLCSPDVRLPSTRLGESDRHAVADILRDWGLLP